MRGRHEVVHLFYEPRQEMKETIISYAGNLAMFILFMSSPYVWGWIT